MKYLTGMLLVALLAIGVVRPSSAAADFLTEPDAEHVAVFQDCYRGSTIIELWWKPRPSASVQVIDLSYVDNGFQPGTFRQEAFTPGKNSVVLPGLRNRAKYYVRVAWIYSDGTWSATRTTSFQTSDCSSRQAASSAPSVSPSNCYLSYEGGTDTQTGECIRRGVGDYDCAGQGGNGPNFVRGPVTVVGSDDFELDDDGDGIGCER